MSDTPETNTSRPTAVWMPVVYYGTTYYQCTLSVFGHQVSATSRSKTRALAHCCIELAAKIEEAGL